MSEKRTPTSYLEDSWGASKGGDADSDYGIPYRAPMPENKDYQIGGLGHSSDCDTDNKAAKWSLDNDDLARGYEKPGDDAGKPGTASNPQDIPSTNEWDRGAGSDAYAREHSATTGTGFDGRGHEKSTPGKQQLGSREVNG